jgi:thioredoxin-like negative regulator of GroEL
LIVIEIDAERFPELAQRELFDVKSVPTLFLFLAGKKIKERRGYLSEEELKNFLNN